MVKNGKAARRGGGPSASSGLPQPHRKQSLPPQHYVQGQHHEQSQGGLWPVTEQLLLCDRKQLPEVQLRRDTHVRGKVTSKETGHFFLNVSPGEFHFLGPSPSEGSHVTQTKSRGLLSGPQGCDGLNGVPQKKIY